MSGDEEYFRRFKFEEHAKSAGVKGEIYCKEFILYYLMSDIVQSVRLGGVLGMEHIKRFFEGVKRDFGMGFFHPHEIDLIFKNVPKFMLIIKSDFGQAKQKCGNNHFLLLKEFEKIKADRIKEFMIKVLGWKLDGQGWDINNPFQNYFLKPGEAQQQHDRYGKDPRKAKF